ncbi:MAG: 3',5'-cyclic-nucleotide phosphodiesterase [Ectothiorhodospiraceae bacterium]|nr:3',5'-cyclic-nucleotide phosphodiesterase [Ectothiorhodospiraceae bacterium]
MKLRVLGCSGGVGNELKTTSLLVDDDILIDAGSGVGELTLDEMRKIRHVFLTHSHLDHFSFLPLLVDSIFPSIRDALVVHGQPVTLKALQTHVFNWTIWPDFAKLPTEDKPVMRYQELTPGDTFELDGRKLEMIGVNHIVPGVGYRMECDTGAFAFSGDTTTNDNLWNVLNGYDRLDLLLVEAAFANADIDLSKRSGHYTADLLAADLKKLRHKPDIYITHNKPGHETVIMSECRQAISDRKVAAAETGLVFTL